MPALPPAAPAPAAPLTVGIDVATAHLDVAVRPTGEQWQAPNDPQGVAALAARLAPLAPGLVVLEACRGQNPTRPDGARRLRGDEGREAYAAAAAGRTAAHLTLARFDLEWLTDRADRLRPPVR
jgi:hypothetical protein